jgi:hypothetical protein
LKFHIRLVSLALSVSVCSVACLAATGAPLPFAPPQSTPSPVAQPTPARTNAPRTAATPSPAQTSAPQSSLSPRERRVKAYAKLMEGQRFFTNARGAGGITREDLRAAQAAFEQAATLDPTLSEAHTALAEIAFFFLDDQTLAEREATAAVRIDDNNFGAHRILSRIYSLKAGLCRRASRRSVAQGRSHSRIG